MSQAAGLTVAGAAAACRRRPGPAALGATVVLVMALMVSGCGVLGDSGPPLMVLSVWPLHGGGLPAGQAVRLGFNFPVDAATLEGRLGISPARDLAVTVRGKQVEIVLVDAQPGGVYVLRVGPGVRGQGGAVLRHVFETTVVVLPPGAAGGAGGVVTAPDPQPDLGEVAGAVLFLEDSVVGACDLPGSYRVPRFDRVRVHLTAPRLPAGQVPALLLAGTATSPARAVDAQVKAGAGHVDLVLGEEVRIGSQYDLVLVLAAAGGASAVRHLWQLHVTGLPWNRIWELDLASGVTVPVGSAGTPGELLELVGGSGRVIAVSRPGGRVWRSLLLLQGLTPELLPSGPAVAAYIDSNHLSGQFHGGTGLLLAVGPHLPPPLVGQARWTGLVPRVPAASQDGSAILAVGGPGVANTLLAGESGVFLAGPSVSLGGESLAYVVREYGQDLVVRLIRQGLPAGWSAPGAGPVEPFPIELARSTWLGEFGSQLAYDGGTAFCAGDEIWWDRHLPDGDIELWQVRERGQRELISSGAAMPVASPDGRYVACRTPAGVAIFAAGAGAGEDPVRSHAEQFEGLTWLPDSSGVLLVGERGILLLPLVGPARRLTAFPARPGCFVGDGRYWFVSNRQL